MHPPPTPPTHAHSTTSPRPTFDLRAWLFDFGWVQVALLVLLATPAFLLGAVAGGIYGATICAFAWLGLRITDEDAAWAERGPLDDES